MEDITPLRQAELEISEIVKRMLPPTVRRGQPMRKLGITRRGPTEMVTWQLRGRQSSKGERIRMLRGVSGHYCRDDVGYDDYEK